MKARLRHNKAVTGKQEIVRQVGVLCKSSVIVASKGHADALANLNGMIEPTNV